jgi:hypothetical protein
MGPKPALEERRHRPPLLKAGSSAPFSPVPIADRETTPTIAGWQHLRISEADGLSRKFSRFSAHSAFNRSPARRTLQVRTLWVDVNSGRQ